VEAIKEVMGLSAYAAERLTKRIADLTDEEYLWEPAPDSWSVRPSGDGTFRGDWGLVFDEVPPVTTIAWRMWHIIDLLSEERCATWIGVDAEPENFFADGGPGTAQGARDLLAKADTRWHRYVDASPAEQLFEKLGPKARGFADDTRFAFVLHIVDELIHHAAEVGTLRDLYRAQRAYDPAVSALLSADRSSIDDTNIARVHTERPNLMLEAAALGRWDALPLLLELGFDISGKDGRTPLHHAAAGGRLDTMRLLLDAGADAGVRDPIYKATPVEWARFFERGEAAELLEKVDA
jgi:hypothetical protein